MKELPEKWCIKNCPEVGKWFDEQIAVSTCYTESCQGYYLHSINESGGDIINKKGNYQYYSYGNIEPRRGFKKITFKQFKYYILNEVDNIKSEDMSYLILILQKYNIK